MELVDVAGALALTGAVLIMCVVWWIMLTKRYSNGHILLLVLGLLGLIAAIWVGAASGWGQG